MLDFQKVGKTPVRVTAAGQSSRIVPANLFKLVLLVMEMAVLVQMPVVSMLVFQVFLNGSSKAFAISPGTARKVLLKGEEL